jgi:hypothetical protein
MHDEAAVYRGIRFSLRSLSHTRWHWEIFPPCESVRGFEQASGEVLGAMTDAMAAAKREIDRQSNAQAKFAGVLKGPKDRSAN